MGSVAKVHEAVEEQAKQLGFKKRKKRELVKREARYVKLLCQACPEGRDEAASLLGMTPTGIYAILQEGKARMVVELAAEYVYKTLYAGMMGEEKKEDKRQSH